MKSLKVIVSAVLAAVLTVGSAGCSSMSNTAKGGLIGTGGGGALGAGIGALIGGGKGAAIGAGVGAVVGAGAGVLIGNKMDKQKKELENQLANASVETVTDPSGYEAIKVTFPGGILFPTGKWTINATAQSELKELATSLKENPLTDVYVCGYTDNTGSMSANEKVATNRADAVKVFLANQGVATSRLTAKGFPMQDYIASNDTEAGREQNRRVEIYLVANEEMVKQANDGTLK